MISLNKLVRTIVGTATPTIQWLCGALFQGPVGYVSGLGVGGVVTQLTSKVTAFELDTLSGQIIFATGALAAYTSSSATWTNSFLTSAAIILFMQNSGSLGKYEFTAVCSNGTAQLVIDNQSSGSLNEVVAVQFLILNAPTS